MEKRTVIAVVVTVIFFVVWFQFVLPMNAPPAPPPQGEQAGQGGAGEGEQPTVQGPREAPQPAPADVDEVAEPEVEVPEPAERPEGEFAVPERYRQENLRAERLTAGTDLFAMAFTTLTGSLESVTLKDYQNFEKDGELILLRDFTENLFPTQMNALAGQDLSSHLWALESPPTEDEQGNTRVAFSTVLSCGVRATKTYILYPGKYGFALEIELVNLNGAPAEVSYQLVGPAGIPSEDYRSNDVYGILASLPAAVGIEGKMTIEKRGAAQFLGTGRRGGRIATAVNMRPNFAGAANRYFAAVLRPGDDVVLSGAYCDGLYDSNAGISSLEGLTAEDLRRKYGDKELKNLAKYFYTTVAVFDVGPHEFAAAGAPGDRVSHAYLMYCGPKNTQALAAFETETFKTGFPVLLDYGWLAPLVKLILLVLRAFHFVIPNWGVAIIMLTILMRLAMHPLMRKSQISMARMQKVQPQIKKLQEKYKNDKQRLGQEQMKLMKEAGANPLGGCLPMLLQLPMFIALYRSLMISIELRHSPFFLWIDDLAQPDRLAQLPVVLPLLGTNFLNLLPILMATSMLLQQKMMPKPATKEAAQQQKMMAIFMPVLIGFFLYSVASGLNLYILTSTAFGMFEQWWTRRHLDALEKAPEPKRGGRTAKK